MSEKKKNEFQETLNLPKTDFSMRAGLINKEPVMLEKWKSEDLYGKIRAKAEGKTPFILHDGPPYANGNIHIGHALNKILKDMIVKQKTMLGHDALYIPGWDCHGLPIEHQLLKEMKSQKSDVEPVEFRKKAHDYAMKWVATQADQFKRLGIFAQWDDPYLTLTPEYEYWILQSLSQLTQDGYIYRSLKPVNWDCQSETALAESEVEHQDHKSTTVYVKFNVNNPEVLGLTDKPVSLLVWTTTPWTLLANVAVAASERLKYVAVDTSKEILILAQPLAESVMAKGGVDSVNVIKELTGEELTQLTYTHVFGKLENCRVVLADYVTADDGTGLVHTAPGHGQDDYLTGVKNKLDVLMPVDEKGKFTEEGAPFTGQFVLKAMPAIIEDLTTRALLFHSEEIMHSYPYSSRTKSPVIFRATEQWFLKIDHNNLRKKIKQAIQKDVTWYPAAGEERITAMVEQRPDWCLSRQRYWGVPIPAVKYKGKPTQYLYPEVIDHLATLVRKEGSGVWFEKDIKDLLPPGFNPPDGDVNDLEKTYDILDVWFDSGVSHRAVFKGMLDGKYDLPADLYLEGSDQHRGWFQSSITPSVAIDGKAPYKGVLTHGFVVDSDGRKMSKSVGNVIKPENIIKQNGADILRLWVSSCNYHDDIRLSTEITARVVDGYRKIRNTFKYILGNLDGFNPDTDKTPYEELCDIDRWALNELSIFHHEITQAYAVYDFPKVYRAIFRFCNERMSGIYLDILKDRLYTSGAQTLERRSAQTVLFEIINVLVRFLAPITVFTAEETYAHMPKTSAMKAIDSVHLLEWPAHDKAWASPTIVKQFELLMEFRPLVLKALEEARRDELIGASLEAKVVITTASNRDYDYFSTFTDELPSLFIASQVEIKKSDDVAQGASESFAKTAITVVSADGDKCPRCWNYRTDIGVEDAQKNVCGRCAKAIELNKNVAVI